ncbi:MAG TPA: tetratricopeptide repeat protein, partial [Bryobacteraceae bacterium]|nr:tetratricopeptide repeat protein [Bryobacteraceae bacterium]
VSEITKKGTGGALAFQPGKLLSDFSLIFVRANSGDTPVISHVERLSQSACKKASGDKLWCVTCHDPHSQPRIEQVATYYRGKCLECHTTSTCTESAEARARAKDNCADCHMPKAPVRTVQHAVYTDHSIPKRPQSSAPVATQGGNELVPFGGATASDRNLALAYADVSLRENNPALGRRAFELLKKAYESDPADDKVAAQLAQIYDRMRNESAACALYERVVRLNPEAIAPAVNLGTCFAKQGRLAESMTLWERVLQQNPGLESARLNLAVAQAQAGNTAAALETLRKALRLNPAFAGARKLLSQIEADSGR